MNQTAKTIETVLGQFPFGNYTNKRNPGWKQQMQDDLLEELRKKVPTSSKKQQIQWDKEVRIYTGNGDRVDIYGDCIPDFQVIIEIDASRADQIAKKTASRFPKAIGCKTIYVAILYPRPDSSSKTECDKYCKYGKTLLKNIDPDNDFIQVDIDVKGNVNSRIL